MRVNHCNMQHAQRAERGIWNRVIFIYYKAPSFSANANGPLLYIWTHSQGWGIGGNAADQSRQP